MTKQSQNHRCYAEFISASHIRYCSLLSAFGGSKAWQSQLEIPNWNIKKDIE
jgi:hypothetical protein